MIKHCPVEIGKRLRRLRIENGYTQELLVKEINRKYERNMSRYYYVQIEKGEANKKGLNLSLLEMFSDFYRVSIDYIIGESEEEDMLIDLRKIANHYGWRHQLGKLKEELSELLVEVEKMEKCSDEEFEQKYLEHTEDRECFITEVSDVRNVSDQMEYFLTAEYEVEQERKRKIARQLERMKRE